MSVCRICDDMTIGPGRDFWRLDKGNCTLDKTLRTAIAKICYKGRKIIYTACKLAGWTSIYWILISIFSIHVLEKVFSGVTYFRSLDQLTCLISKSTTSAQWISFWCCVCTIRLAPWTVLSNIFILSINIFWSVSHRNNCSSCTKCCWRHFFFNGSLLSSIFISTIVDWLRKFSWVILLNYELLRLWVVTIVEKNSLVWFIKYSFCCGSNYRTTTIINFFSDLLKFWSLTWFLSLLLVIIKLMCSLLCRWRIFVIWCLLLNLQCLELFDIF